MGAKRETWGLGRPAVRLGLTLCVVGHLAVGCVTVTGDDERRSLERQVEAKRHVGIDHLANGRVPMAIRELQYAETLNPKDSETQMWLAEAFRRKGRLEQAELHIERALELDPDDQKTQLSASVLYVQLERYEDAIVHAQVLIDDPTFSSPWRPLNNRGWAQLRLGLLSEAHLSFSEALDYHPGYWPALLNLGILADMQGHKLQAVEHFQAALGSELDQYASSETNYRLAEVYISLGRRRMAVDHLEQAAAQEPTGRWAKMSEDYLSRLR